MFWENTENSSVKFFTLPSSLFNLFKMSVLACNIQYLNISANYLCII